MLDAAVVLKISGDHMLISGVEKLQRGRNYLTFPQVWWCRQAVHAPPPPEEDGEDEEGLD